MIAMKAFECLALLLKEQTDLQDFFLTSCKEKSHHYQLPSDSLFFFFFFSSLIFLLLPLTLIRHLILCQSLFMSSPSHLLNSSNTSAHIFTPFSSLFQSSKSSFSLLKWPKEISKNPVWLGEYPFSYNLMYRVNVTHFRSS